MTKQTSIDWKVQQLFDKIEQLFYKIEHLEDLILSLHDVLANEVDFEIDFPIDNWDFH